MLGCGGGKERCVGSGEVWESVWGEWGGVWESVWGEEVCWRVGEEWGNCREMCLGVGPQRTSPHLLPHLTFPCISPYRYLPNTLSYTSLSHLFPHLASHPNTFFYYLHISPHLLKVWRSYHVMKFLWQSYCGEVTGNHEIFDVLICDHVFQLCHQNLITV